MCVSIQIQYVVLDVAEGIEVVRKEMNDTLHPGYEELLREAYDSLRKAHSALVDVQDFKREMRG
jgi:hypothetical protein